MNDSKKRTIGTVRATKEDLIEPGIRMMLHNNESYEVMVDTVASGLLGHKKWKKPARELLNNVLIRLANKHG